MTVAFSSFPSAKLLSLSSCELHKEGRKGDQSPSHLQPDTGQQPDNLPISQGSMPAYGKHWASLTLLIHMVFPSDAGLFDNFLSKLQT